MSEPKQFVLNGVCFDDVQEYVEKLRADLAYTKVELVRALDDIKSYRAIVDSRDAELATLRAKMAGMVCGACKGTRWIPWRDGAEKACPVCQPAKEGKQS